MNFEQAKNILNQHGQAHLLKYYDVLNDVERAELLKEIDSLDLSVIENAKRNSAGGERGRISPIKAMELDEIKSRHDEYKDAGIKAIREGKVGAVLLAGGMGTRLGSDAPKGVYNIGVTKDVYIFERIIENLMDVVRETNTWLHLFIMTSDKNHEATVDFLSAHDYFGYKSEYITFFKQDMSPATDYNGKIFLEEKGHIAMSPNGNGGWFSSMKRGGALKIAQDAGIEWLNIFAVDNVLQRIADPLFVGATVMSGSASGAKVVRKNAPDEKVGVMCLEDGRPSIVEYYELTDTLMSERNEKGDPAYNFGVILNYLFRVDELVDMVRVNMPMHIVEKKITHIDDGGEIVKPDKPNGYKYETLILDMVHLSKSCLPFEVVRECEFAPIKNKTGIDSVESARELLKKNGITL